MKSISIYSIVFLFSLVACELTNDDVSRLDELLISDQNISNQEVRILINEDNSVNLDGTNFQGIFNYLNNKFNTQVDNVTHVMLKEVSNSSRLNLFMYLQESKTQKRIPFALVIDRVDDPLAGSEIFKKRPPVYSIRTVHTCSGNPCSCCDFLEDGNGEIIGCECNSTIWNDGCSGSSCNHTVSTGGGGNEK